jgi:hypothetical protein
LLKGTSLESTTQKSIAPLSDTSLPLGLAELIEEPDKYEGNHLQLNGALERAPAMDCDTKTRGIPASWILFDGESEIPVAGLSTELNRAASGISSTILEGRWVKWQGPHGCGRSAETVELWYLDAYRVVSPNPIALVPVISQNTDQITGNLVVRSSPESSAEATVTATRPISPDEIGTPSPMAPTPIPQVDQPSVTETGTALHIFTPVITPELIQPSLTPTQRSNGVTSTSAPAATSTTPTPTMTVENTPSATVTTAAPLIIFRMELEVSSIETGRLGVNEVHRWTHTITETRRLSVSVASDYFLDTSIKVIDPAGLTIVDQNFTAEGLPEIVVGITLIEPGLYDILISSPSGDSGNYAILISDDESYPFIFQRTLLVGDSGSAFMQQETDHFWHFTGAAGQAVTISVVPRDSSDLFLNLFGTDGVSLIRFHDETAAGEPEQLIGYILPDTGIYSLRIGEFNFGSADYEIFLAEG